MVGFVIEGGLGGEGDVRSTGGRRTVSVRRDGCSFPKRVEKYSGTF